MQILNTLLDEIESTLDEAEESRILNECRTFLHSGAPSQWFAPKRRPASLSVSPEPYHINEAITSPEKIVYNEFAMITKRLTSGWGGLLNVRANYGVGILSSVFGAELFIMPEEMHCLPNTRSLPGGRDGIRALIDKGVPDLNTGWGSDVFAAGELIRKILDERPTLGAWVRVDHPDLQGPMDICELLWGSDIFLALYEEPELVHELLDLVTRTYIEFLEKWHAVCPPNSDGIHAYRHISFKGTICIRDDSAMNLSPEMYREFIQPYNSRLLSHFGGGAIHACGRVDHWVQALQDLPGLTAFNMSQPEYNNMEVVYANTIDKGISLIGLKESAIREAVARGRELHGRVSLEVWI